MGALSSKMGRHSASGEGSIKIDINVGGTEEDVGDGGTNATRSPSPRTLRKLVDALLKPSKDAFEPATEGAKVIQYLFVVGNFEKAGLLHLLEWDNRIHRLVLNRDTKLYCRGQDLGLPERYLHWLSGESVDDGAGDTPLALLWGDLGKADEHVNGQILRNLKKCGLI